VSNQLSNYGGDQTGTHPGDRGASRRSISTQGRPPGLLHTEEVTGSNPVSPTRVDARFDLATTFQHLRPPSMLRRPDPSGRSTLCKEIVTANSSAQWRGMQASEVSRAVAAAMSTASSLDLTVDDAIVLHDSNKLTLRLLPCDGLARVAPAAHQVGFEFEVELAQRLAESGCPVAALEPRSEPRVYERDGFVVTLWTYYEPVTSRERSPADYANALERLHVGMRELDVPTPHFTDRVDSAEQLVASRDRTPALADADRELLGDTLRRLRRVIGERGVEQLLHGEPHPGNVLVTKHGLLFIDLETCCRGPVEFDLAHAPEDVSEHYPGINQALLRDCRILVLAMITTWRWDRGDQLPNGRRLGTEWLSQIRAALSA
jgi:hypothetical protein